MPRTGYTLSLPNFTGVTRRLVLANVIVFFALAILGHVSPLRADDLNQILALIPASVIHGALWQLVTYSFVHSGIGHIFFNMLSLWFIGAWLESELGSRWLTEIYFVSVIGAALTTVAFSYTHLFGMLPSASTVGASGGIFGLLAAFAVLFGEQRFLLFFVLPIKARHLVILYVLFAVAMLLDGPNGVAYLAHLGGALFGYLYVKVMPRRGLTFAFSERYFALRNSYYRWRRRRAARKFEVYMGKHGRDVRFDREGRYIDPDKDRDPNDRRWMN